MNQELKFNFITNREMNILSISLYYDAWKLLG